MGRARGEEGGVGTTRGGAGGGQISAVDIQPRVLLFPFCSSVLEPNFDLKLSKEIRTCCIK